jgi:hypothetical protein
MTDDEARALGDRLAPLLLERIAHPLPNADWRARGAAFPTPTRAFGGTLWRPDRETLTWWPDARDPATKGVLLDLVRKRWQVDDLAPQRTAEPTEEGRQRLARGPQWGVPTVSGWNIRPRTLGEQHIARRIGMQPSEEAWLVAAMEARE